MLQSEIDISSCDLCPRVCGVDRSAGARGVCGADGRLRIARAALHFWEEPPISGTHGSGTVFFSWCPLRCVYCQNAVIADGEAGAEISIERLAQIYSELQAKGALNINLVTPTRAACARRARFGAGAGDGPSRRLEHLGIRNGLRRPRKPRLCGCVSHRLQICLFRSGCPIFKGS